MERITAEAWSRMFAISTLLSGASGLLAGIISLLVSPFAVDPELGRLGAIVVSLFSAVFVIIFSGLFLLLGAGLWNYRPWSRTVMQVIAWILAIGGGIVALILLFIGAFAMVDPTGELSAAFGLFLFCAGIALAVVAAFYLWFFHFSPDVRALFVNTKGDWKVRIDNAHKAVTQAWAINSWLSAAWLAIAGIVALAYGNRIIDFMIAALAEDPGLPQALEIFNAIRPWVLPIGIGLLVVAAASSFIAYGLWRLQEWARVTTVVFAWLLGAGAVLGVIAVPFFAASVYEGGTNLGSLLQYGLIAGLEIWFFGLPQTKALFKPKRGR